MRARASGKGKNGRKDGKGEFEERKKKDKMDVGSGVMRGRYIRMNVVQDVGRKVEGLDQIHHPTGR